MKTILRIELFGEDVRQNYELFRNILNEGVPGLGDQALGRVPSSGWIAEITGSDQKYKYARSFLRAKRDYRKSNYSGSRGVFAEYILESGRIYEVKQQMSWSRSERFFCKVSDDGDIVKLDESEVIECLKRRSE